MAVPQGQLVNSNTLNTISIPVGICHMKSSTFSPFNAMWRFLAVSFPFCIAGTRAAAAAHNAVIAAQGKANQKHHSGCCRYENFGNFNSTQLKKTSFKVVGGGWGWAASNANPHAIPAPAKRWGPGNSFPVLNHVLTPPPIDSKTPNPSSIEPALKCLSLKDPLISSFLSWILIQNVQHK